MADDTLVGSGKAEARDWIGLAVLALPCIIYSMDLTVLHLAVPQIAAALRPSSSELLWIVDIYGFMVAGALITMGTLGDRIGRRRLLLIGAAVFGATSALAAFSTTPATLIAARALLGLAAATLAPSTLSLIRSMFHDDRERALAIGVWVGCFSVGAAVGPVVGGFILAHYWWGAVFLINIPVMLLLLGVGPYLLREFRDPDAGRIDLLSAAQSMAAVLAVIYGLKRIAEAGLAPLPLFAVGAGVLIGAYFFQRQSALSDPLIDIGLFRIPAFSAALGTNIVALFMVFGTFLFIAQYLQLVLGMGPLEAGLWTAPSGVVFALGSVATPFLVRRFEPYVIISVGFVITAAGFLVLTQLGAADGPWVLFLGMMILCLGVAPTGAITTDIVLAKAPPERAGAASAISETSFEFGGALGIAVLGSLVTAVYRSAMAGEPLAGVPVTSMAAARDTLGGAVAAAAELGDPARTALLGTAREAFVSAFVAASAVSAATALGAAVLAVITLRNGRR